MVNQPIAKHVTLPEAEAQLERLERFAQNSAAYYGAVPGESADALAALADLRAWLSDLANRNQRIQL